MTPNMRMWEYRLKMKKSSLFITVLFIGAVLICAPKKAYGQGNTWAGANLQQMVDAARWKFGLLRVNAAFSLVNAGYDSDVYYGHFNDPVPDFTLSAGLPIQVLVPASKKIVFDFFENPQYLYYLDSKNERAWNNTFRGRAHIAMENFYIRVGGGLSNVRRRLSPELDVNFRQKTNSLEGLFLWQASRRTSLAMVYGGADYDHEDAVFSGTNIAERLNRIENLFDLVVYLQPSARARFFLDGQYGTYALPETTEITRDAQSYGIFGGLEFIPREGELVPAARVQGSISLGYIRFDMKAPQFVDGAGLAGTVNLSVGLLRRTTTRAFFSRGFQFSVYSGASYYIATSYGAGITRLLSRRVSMSYGFSFGRSDYPEAEGGGGIPLGPSYRYTTHTVSLDIRLARNLSMTFSGTFMRRLLVEIGSAWNRNFIGFNLVYGYPPAGISTPMWGMNR